MKRVLVCLLALCLVGCGGSKKEEKVEQKNDVVVQTEEKKEETTTPVESQSEVKVEESKPEPEPEPEPEPAPAPVQETNNGIRPEFQKEMDDYLAFYTQYCEFMKNYDATDFKMLAEYGKLMIQYEKVAKDFDAVDDSEMSDAEYDLFLQTQLKINQMLYDVLD